MKKLTFLFAIGSMILISSCQKTQTLAEKASGTYNGGCTINTTDYTGSTVITTNSDNTVNLTLNIPSESMSATATGVSLTESGQKILLTYTSGSTTEGGLIGISTNYGVEGNSLSYGFTLYYAGGNESGAFTGNK